MKIGNVKLSNNIFLAPMAGVTDRPFRTLCKMLGAGLTYTEMVSVKGLYYKSIKTEELLRTSNLEHPCAVQLFGHEPEIFKSVIESGVLDKFDIIDINMGCPAPKIVKNGDGSALMNDIQLASQIIKACKSATTKPITVKFRKGFKKSDNKLVEFAKMCELSGASAITIHPRTREDMFSGTINLDDIKLVKENVNIPVIGNGDVTSVDEYNKMNSICDAVMIGRETLKRPEIFLEILQANKESLKDISFFDYYDKIINKEQNVFECLYNEYNKLKEDFCLDKKTNIGKKISNTSKIEYAESLHNKTKILEENLQDIETKNAIGDDTLNLNDTLKIPTKLQTIKMHLALLKGEYKEDLIVKLFKKHILWYLSGFKNSTSLKKEIVLITDLKVMEDKIFNFFSTEL